MLLLINYKIYFFKLLSIGSNVSLYPAIELRDISEDSEILRVTRLQIRVYERGAYNSSEIPFLVWFIAHNEAST